MNKAGVLTIAVAFGLLLGSMPGRVQAGDDSGVTASWWGKPVAQMTGSGTSGSPEVTGLFGQPVPDPRFAGSTESGSTPPEWKGWGESVAQMANALPPTGTWQLRTGNTPPPWYNQPYQMEHPEAWTAPSVTTASEHARAFLFGEGGLF